MGMDWLPNNQRHLNNIDHLDSVDIGFVRKLLSRLLQKPLQTFIAGIAFLFLLLTVLSFFGSYPVPIFEKVVDPHMYYIKDFVHSLPVEVQNQMKKDAADLGLDIYEYNLQICGYKPESYWEWWL